MVQDDLELPVACCEPSLCHTFIRYDKFFTFQASVDSVTGA